MPRRWRSSEASGRGATARRSSDAGARNHSAAPPCVMRSSRRHRAASSIGTARSRPATAGPAWRLAAAGVEVVVADHAPSRRLHEGYITRIAKGRPFVSAKLAVSADGMVGARWHGDCPSSAAGRTLGRAAKALSRRGAGRVGVGAEPKTRLGVGSMASQTASRCASGRRRCATRDRVASCSPRRPVTRR